MQHKSRPLGLLFSLLFGGTLVGCYPPVSTSTGPSAPDFTRVTLKLACAGEDQARLIDEYGNRWMNHRGGKIEVIPLLPGEALPKDADIVICLAGDMPSHHEALLPLPEMFQRGTAYDYSRILPLYRDKLLVWDKTPKAVPLQGEAPLCFHRKDLLAEAESKLGGTYKAPTTWEEYLALAQLFHDKPALEWKGPTLPPLPRDPAELEREFYSIAAPFARRALTKPDKSLSQREMFSFHFDLQSMEPRIDKPAFVHALRVMQQLQKMRPPGDAEHPAEAFAKGEAVLCVADARWTYVFQNQKGPIRDKFGFARLPGAGLVFPFDQGSPVEQSNNMPYLGTTSWVAGVSKNGSHPDAAWDFLASVTGKETSQQIVTDNRWGGGPTRSDQLDNATSWNGFRLDAKGTGDLLHKVQQTLTHNELVNPVLTLRVPRRYAYQQKLVAELREALLHGKDAQAALTAVADDWRALTSKAGPTARRDYYYSLSLEPVP